MQLRFYVQCGCESDLDCDLCNPRSAYGTALFICFVQLGKSTLMYSQGADTKYYMWCIRVEYVHLTFYREI